MIKRLLEVMAKNYEITVEIHYKKTMGTMLAIKILCKWLMKLKKRGRKPNDILALMR